MIARCWIRSERRPLLIQHFLRRRVGEKSTSGSTNRVSRIARWLSKLKEVAIKADSAEA